MSSTPTVTSITSDITREVVSDAYRADVGHGKAWSRAKVSEATGIDVQTLDNYRSGETSPELHNFLRLCAALGPAYANRVLALAGLEGARRIEQGPTCALTVNASAARLVALVGAMLTDAHSPGRIDHAEEARVEQEARELLVELEDFLAQRAAKRGHLRAVG